MSFKEFKQIQELQPQSQNQPNQIVSIKSDIFDQYLKLLECSAQKHKNIEVIQNDKFSDNRIMYNNKLSHVQFKITILKQSINSQAFVLKVEWGKFCINLKVLNCSISNQTHKLSCKKGGYGQVYFIPNFKEQFVVKCIHLKKFKQVYTAKIMAIKELFILKIADVLQVGSHMDSWLGFDLVIYQECIQFAMEKCKSIVNLNFQKIKLIQNQLSLLHSYNIIHFDIKPQNIMFSPYFQKQIFIDFGLSEIVAENKGQKSLYYFRGSLNYASPAMIRIFQQKEKAYIDVYYNDAFCLSQISKSFSNKQDDEIQIEDDFVNLNLLQQQQKEKILYSIPLLFQIQCFIFQQKIKQLIILYNTQKQLINKLWISYVLDFLYEVNASKELKQFYHTFIDSIYKDSIRFDDLKYIYHSSKLSQKIRPNLQKNFLNYEANRMIIQNLDSIDCFRDEIALHQLLTSRKQVTKISKHVYFKAYLKYISFSNNIYGLSNEQRAQISCILIAKYYPNEILDCSSSNQQIIKTIILIFLEYVKGNEQDSKQLIVLNINQIIEHIFILKIIISQQLLQIIYQKQYLSKYDRLQLLLNIKQNNNWYIFTSSRNRDDTQHQQFYMDIKNWCISKLNQLRLQYDSEQADIFELVMQNMVSYNSIQIVSNQSTLLKHFPYGLKRLLTFEFHYKIIAHQKSALVLFSIQAIYDMIQNQQKNKIFFFLFYIFIYQLEQHRNLQKCYQILKIFDYNLSNAQLSKQLLFRYFIFTTQNYIDVNLIPKYLNQYQLMLQNLNFTMLLFHCKFIKFSLITFQQFRVYFQTFSFQPQQLTQLSKIQYKIKIIYNWLNFSNIFGSDHHHQCYDYSLILDFIDIKRLINRIMIINYNVFQDLEVMRLVNSCQNCLFTTTIANLFQKQKQLIYQFNIGNTQPANQIFIIDLYNEIMQNIAKYLNCQQAVKFIKHSLYILANLCKKSIKMQNKYQGVRKLYYYLKLQKQLDAYLVYSPYHFQILKVTFLMMMKEKQQFAWFLNYLGQYLTTYFSESIFQLIFKCFSQFVGIYKDQINFTQFFCSLRIQEKINNQQSQQKNVYNIIYYYILLFYTTHQYFKKCLLQICYKINKVTFRMRVFFQLHIYRCIYQKMVQKYQIKRRIQFIKIKMVKLFNIYGKIPAKIKIKIHKNNNKVKLLELKAAKLGGPYRMYLKNISPIFVTVNQK